jgi:cell division septal protein FtsQ
MYRPRLGAVSSQPDGLRRLRLIAAAAALLLAAETIYILFHSPRFAVTAVELQGDARVAGQVAKRLRLPANTNLFLSPTARMEKLAESVPAVQEARVARTWRRHLVVALDRREAMAVIRREQQAMLVDPTGVVFTIPNEWGWGLPELVAPHLSTGDAASPSAKAEVTQLLGALRALGPDPRLRIARLQLDKAGRLLATLDSGAKVRFGTADRLGLKTNLLVTIMDQLGAERIEFLDLSDPWAAYWRERP